MSIYDRTNKLITNALKNGKIDVDLIILTNYEGMMKTEKVS